MKLLVTILAILLPLAELQQDSNYARCYTGLHFYKIDCNTCWCAGIGIPICTKQICEKVPDKYQGFNSHNENKQSVTREVKNGNGKTVKVTIYTDE